MAKQTTQAALDKGWSYVPAWRIAKCRRALAAAHHEGEAGEECGHSHRALRRRWAMGRATLARSTNGKKRVIGFAEEKLIWQAICSARGSLEPRQAARGAQKRAYELAVAACHAAGWPGPSYATVHSWFCYGVVPVEWRQEFLQLVREPEPISTPKAGIDIAPDAQLDLMAYAHCSGRSTEDLVAQAVREYVRKQSKLSPSRRRAFEAARVQLAGQTSPHDG